MTQSALLVASASSNLYSPSPSPFSVSFNFYYMSLLQIFNFISLHTFMLVSSNFSFSSYLFLPVYPTWPAPLYESHCLVNFFPFFTSSSSSSNPFPQHRHFICPLLPNTLKARGRILLQTCATTFFNCMVLFSITQHFYCRPLLCFFLVYYVSK